MALQGPLKSLKIIEKWGLETVLPQSLKKVRKCSPSRPQKQRFRMWGVTKTTKSKSPEKVSRQQASQNHPDIYNKATLGATWNSISKTWPKNVKTEPDKPPKRKPTSSKNHQKVALGSHWAHSGRLWPQKSAQEGVPPLKITQKKTTTGQIAR